MDKDSMESGQRTYGEERDGGKVLDAENGR